MGSPRPCLATLSRSRTPRDPQSRASSGGMFGYPIGSIESTGYSPSSIRYHTPHSHPRLIQIRTLQVILPRRIPSLSRL